MTDLLPETDFLHKPDCLQKTDATLRNPTAGEQAGTAQFDPQARQRQPLQSDLFGYTGVLPDNSAGRHQSGNLANNRSDNRSNNSSHESAENRTNNQAHIRIQNRPENRPRSVAQKRSRTEKLNATDILGIATPTTQTVAPQTILTSDKRPQFSNTTEDRDMRIALQLAATLKGRGKYQKIYRAMTRSQRRQAGNAICGHLIASLKAQNQSYSLEADQARG